MDKIRIISIFQKIRDFYALKCKMLLISYISIAWRVSKGRSFFMQRTFHQVQKKRRCCLFLVSDELVNFPGVPWTGQNIPRLLGSLWPAPSVWRLWLCWNFLHVCPRGQLGEGWCATRCNAEFVECKLVLCSCSACCGFVLAVTS